MLRVTIHKVAHILEVWSRRRRARLERPALQATGPPRLSAATGRARWPVLAGVAVILLACQAVVAGMAGLLVEDAGPVAAVVPASGDDGLHALTRARHAILSVACDQIQPLPYLDVVGEWATGHPHWWSARYLHAVASRAGEIALMTYDTGIPLPAAYSGYVRLETRLALQAAPPPVTVLIGLPAYHDSEPGHTSAETVANAVRGVRLALGARAPRQPAGVALYAGFSATPADWAAYLIDWVRPGRRPGNSSRL